MIQTTHNCDREHCSYQSLAHCLWPEAIRITGSGPHAAVSTCGLGQVALFDSAWQADVHVGRMTRSGCASGCTGSHERHVLAVSIGTAPRRSRLRDLCLTQLAG